jgi:transcriptional regulator with XRE-family HTH domain
VIVYDRPTAQFRAMSLKPESLLPQSVVEAMKNDAVGHRLKLLRKSQGLKPSEMADGLGIDRTYWSRFEGGKQGLSDSVAALLCIKYKVTLDWLILGDWSKLPFELAEQIRSVKPK